MKRNTRLTNKWIIEELFPILQWALTQEVEFENKDFYGHPYKQIQKNGFPIRWTRYEDGVIITVTMQLSGKYDHATVDALLRGGKIEFSYSKEFTGMGNGYYAELDEKGKIIKGEWD